MKIWRYRKLDELYLISIPPKLSTSFQFTQGYQGESGAQGWYQYVTWFICPIPISCIWRNWFNANNCFDASRQFSFYFRQLLAHSRAAFSWLPRGSICQQFKAVNNSKWPQIWTRSLRLQDLWLLHPVSVLDGPHNNNLPQLYLPPLHPSISFRQIKVLSITRLQLLQPLLWLRPWLALRQVTIRALEQVLVLWDIPDLSLRQIYIFSSKKNKKQL